VKRREVWRRLRREGFRVPALELSTPAALSSTLLVLKLSAAFASWLQSRLATCVIVPIGFIIFRVNRRWAVHFPENWLTVGELALRLTPFGDHMGSGGWWTQEDISQKVRLVLAECLNIDAKDIRPESTLRELGAE
jgi:hypothetical protein